ncbi:DUF6959 family protein [Streptomyces sp. NPDC087844]|uniref:DUF6959 family protein n=1 Tax=Streptomyces sp. NPDC087844 TaxID=3365805 RepID=UPI0038266A7F
MLRSDVAESAEACERGEAAEAGKPAGLLLSALDALLIRYPTALEEHQIQRPYRVAGLSAWGIPGARGGRRCSAAVIPRVRGACGVAPRCSWLPLLTARLGTDGTRDREL